MSKSWALLLLRLSSVACAQSVLIPASQCLWHAGDNPAWAAPNLDEAGWQPYTVWRIDGRSPHIWVRCHANLSPLASLAHPALKFEYGRAFQVFLNGQQIGSSGDLSGGWYTSGLAPVFPVHESASGLDHAVIAVRISYRTFEESEPIRVAAGEEQWLAERHDSMALHRSLPFQPVEVCYLAIGFAGFLLLGMYLNDRRRLELLLLAFCCWCQLINRTIDYIDIAAIPVPWTLIAALFAVGQCFGLPLVWFFFRLAGKRVPWLFRILICVGLLYPIQALIGLTLPLNWSLLTSTAFFSTFAAQTAVVVLTALATPLVAFWPWSQIEKRLRSLALCGLLWVSVETVWLISVNITSAFAEEARMMQQWINPLLLIRAFATLAVIIALVALLFRDQRRTAEERAMLAILANRFMRTRREEQRMITELEAARSVQSLLVSAAAQETPGFDVESVYLPASEVGGDFFQMQPVNDGSLLIVVGDVSGKGLQAAMTVSAIIGALRGDTKTKPSEVIAYLNRVLHGQVTGFVTCCVARISSQGEMTIANAGHLSPYCNGAELAVANGLPLGITASTSYVETHFNLAPGDRLTFISDGVVEASNVKRELFGFTRAEQIIHQPAAAIAEAAQRWGQEDDITVLTVARATTVEATA